MLGGLILELGHSGKLSEHGVAVQNPAQLCMLRNMALDEKHALLRIDAAGKIDGHSLIGPFAQIGRLLSDGDGVQVRHAVIAIVFLLQKGPVSDGS